LASKENAVTTVAIVGLLDWWYVQRSGADNRSRFLKRRALRCYVPMAAVIALYLALRVHFIGGLASGPEVVDHFDNPIAHPTQGLAPGDSAFLARWATPLATLAKAVRLHLVPTGLCFDYSYAAIETVRSVDDLRMWAGLGLLFVAVAASIISYRRQRRVLLAIAISAATYAIVSNIILLGTIFGERLLYVPSIGYCMLIGLAAEFAFGSSGRGPNGRRGPLAVVAAIALPLMGFWYCHLTVSRNCDWSSPDRLYASAYRVNPTSCKVLSGMASIAMDLGHYRQAHDYCRQAAKAAPKYWPAWRTAALALRRLAEQENDPGRQQYLYDKALEYYQEALHLGAAADPEAMIGAAELYVRNGDYRRAIGILEQIVAYAPLDARALNELARCLVTAEPPDLRDPARALECIKRAMALRPEVANYVDTYVDVLLAFDQKEGAVAVIHKVLSTLPPASPGAIHFRKRLAELQQQPSTKPAVTTAPAD
jgi:Flp pilus assembly protein TadD